MPRFADLKDERIGFFNQYRELILGLVDELFEDGVIGHNDWEVVEWDTQISICRRVKPEQDYYLDIEMVDNDNQVSCLGLSGRIRGYPSYCYPDHDDLVIGLRRAFSGKKLEEPTQYEKDKEKSKLQSDEERKRLFIEKFGHLLDFDRIDDVVKSLDGNWNLNTISYSGVRYKFVKPFNTYKWNVDSVLATMTLHFGVNEEKGKLSLSLRCEYDGKKQIAARSSDISMGSESWYATLDNLDDLEREINGLLSEARQFQRDRF